MNYKLIDMRVFGDERGHLISLEKGNNCPFEVKRAFYIFDTKPGIARGAHANRNSEFMLIPISGSCKVRIDDGSSSETVKLSDPHKALYLDKMLWKEMFDFSYNAILLVLTNTLYDEKEYIRDYNEYLRAATPDLGGGKTLSLTDFQPYGMVA